MPYARKCLLTMKSKHFASNRKMKIGLETPKSYLGLWLTTVLYKVNCWNAFRRKNMLLK